MSDSSLQQKYSLLIKQEAERLGFTACGISKSQFLEEDAPHLEAYLKVNSHGEMGYLANNFDKRLNPSLLVEGTKSVVSLLYNYYTEDQPKDPAAPKISMYAYGKDYHKVVKKKLKLLFQFIQEEIGEVGGRYFVDSAPILEKAWAAKSGIGWVGKNANLLTKQKGSFHFISELLLDIELGYDSSTTNHCGQCTKCIDACPTDAIIAPYRVDGSKCISYFTIELKEQIPVENKGKFEDWMFGCDICQTVCPWNRFSTEHNEPLFYPQSRLLEISKEEWNNLSEGEFDEIFFGSAVKRTKFEGLKRNIDFLG